MAIRQVQKVSATQFASAIFPSNTQGNFLLCLIQWGSSDAANPTVSDTVGNSWILLPKYSGYPLGANPVNIRVAYVFQCKQSNGNNTVTVSPDLTTIDGGLAIIEYSGVGANPLDVSAGTITSGTTTATPTSNSFTTLVANELVVATMAAKAEAGRTITAGNVLGVAATLDVSGPNDVMVAEEILTGAAGVGTAAFNVAGGNWDRWIMYVVSFRPAVDATTTSPYLGIFSKDSVLSCGAFDMGVPNARYGWYDDDFVAQFSGTTVGATATGIASVPPGVFSKDATLDGAFDD